jgi:hypothetical protein
MKTPVFLRNVLEPAFHPCSSLTSDCSDMRWAPERGHVPRGFHGAYGRPSEVEAIFVFAEPGDPHTGEVHTGLDSAYAFAGTAFTEGTDLFHRNVRFILDLCWPAESLESQMRKVWLTESVLCAAKIEGGVIPKQSTLACGNRYLRGQLAVFPQAVVVALGNKAQNRLRAIGITNFLSAYAAAPPGCNFTAAIPSWRRVADIIRSGNKQLQLPVGGT